MNTYKLTMLLATILTLFLMTSFAFSQDALFIDENGRVGIGTTTPSEKLDVNGNIRIGSSSGKLIIRRQDDLADIDIIETGNPLKFGVIDGASNELAIYAAQDEAIRIDSSGNVGIGTTSPNSKLEVSGGDIRVTGGSFIDDGTSLNAPDYVFEKDYQLMHLNELRAFIGREGHLPNVPNADEIKKNGLNISKFQMRLLEKIEELTLYTLAQQKEIEELKARLNERQ